MGATSIDELLAMAAAAATSAAPALYNYPQDDTRAAAAQEAAWPKLAEAALHLLEGVHLQHADAARYQPVRRLLARRVQAAIDDVAPDPSLLRTAELINAAGDACRALGHPRPDSRVADRTVAIVVIAATLSAVQAERARTGSAGIWLRLANAAREGVMTTPPERSSLPGARPISTDLDPSLDASLQRFHRTATRLVGLGELSMDARAIPHVLAAAHHVAARVVSNARNSHRDASGYWRQASEAWPVSLRLPGAPDVGLRTQANDLIARMGGLGAAVADGRQDNVNPVRLYLADQAGELGRAYWSYIRDVVLAERLVTPARSLAQTMRPVSVEVAAAANRGEWVRLPRESPPARTIVAATSRAARADAYAADTPDGQVVHLDGYAIAARRAAALNFLRSAPAAARPAQAEHPPSARTPGTAVER